MVKTGDLVMFKPGLFEIEIPNNYGIFVKRFRRKNSKDNFVQLYTIKGNQETKYVNINKKRLGRHIQLRGGVLPEAKEIRKRLIAWIKELSEIDEKVQDAVTVTLNEKNLWEKVIDTNQSAMDEMAIAKIWYEIPAEDISKSRLRTIRDVLNDCRPYGKGHFDIVDKLWLPLSLDEKKKIGAAIGNYGKIRNRMFHMVEMLVEDSEDPEETEMVKTPLPWDDIPFTNSENEIFTQLQDVMVFFVENNQWPQFGMVDSHIYALDGFSIRSFTSFLAEDWINEGRTSYSDGFVKLLIRSGYWTDTEALYAISKRTIHLAKYFDWETEERIEKLAAVYREPKDTEGAFDNRTDLMKLENYTIDPPTAKDFDDAISLDITKEGYVLWVHIADVANYVVKDSSLDLHARRRSTSVYLPTKTLPMLPHHLSDNLCSLREQTPRLAMSVEIHYDKSGNRLNDKCKVHNSVILVTKNLSYDIVNTSIDNEEEPFYSYHKFSLLLNKHRKGLMIKSDNIRLELGGQMSLQTKSASNSTQMIESFMVSANETVAEILQNNSLPVVYRNHPLPDKIDVERFNMHAKVIGIDYEIEYPDLFDTPKEDEETNLMDLLSQKGGNISFSLGSGTSFADSLKEQLDDKSEEDEIDLGTPIAKGLAQLTEEKREEILKPFREILTMVENIKDRYSKKLGYLIVLRTLSRAVYAAGNTGHFGLGSAAYLHFTSPIRRYPDIIAHRVCKAMIEGSELVYDAEEIDDVAAHCTEQSEIAEKLERTIIGSGFSFLSRNPDYHENRQGIVTSISGGGVFVTLPNGIEARIPLRKMAGGPTFVDDYDSICFLGSRTGFEIENELTPDNWQDLLRDDADEPIQIITQLGDLITLEFSGWDHIDGRVEAIPVKINDRLIEFE